jgi:hypothetical protein
MSGGASGGSQKGNTHNWGNYSGNTSTTSNPIIPTQWNDSYTGAMNFLGPSGVSQTQQGFINTLGGNTPNLDQFNTGMDAYTKAGYYSLQDLSKNSGGEWATPDPVKAQQVQARTGASFMGDYRNPFDKDVIDATAADYDAQFAKDLAGWGAMQDSAGAFGDRGALAKAQLIADAGRGRASLLGGLRQLGFNTAAGLGQADANRFAAVDTGNADRTLAADTFNSNQIDSRQRFSVNQAMQGDAQRMQALRDLRDTAFAGSAENRSNILAQSGIASGGVGQLTNLLGLGTNTFGQQTDTTASGESENWGTSGSKSKGGGVSGGFGT